VKVATILSHVFHNISSGMLEIITCAVDESSLYGLM